MPGKTISINLNLLTELTFILFFDSWDKKNNPHPWLNVKHNEQLKVSWCKIKKTILVTHSHLFPVTEFWEFDSTHTNYHIAQLINSVTCPDSCGSLEKWGAYSFLYCLHKGSHLLKILFKAVLVGGATYIDIVRG